MKSIKMRGICAAVTGALLFGFGANAMADSTTDIVNALVAKGVLTEEEGALLNKGREGEAAGQAKAMKKASKLSVSDAIDNATIYGDIRARYERREGDRVTASSTTNGKVIDSNRARYKITMGVETKSGDFYSDLAFALSDNGRSDNISFGDNSAPYMKNASGVYVKRAMIGYKATDWLSIEVGKMKNPLYMVNAMVFDHDIVMEGAQEKFNYKLNDSTTLFGTLGQWIYTGPEVGSNTDITTTSRQNMVLAFQGGVEQAFNDKLTGKGAIGFYNYTARNSGATANFVPVVGTDAQTPAAQQPNDLQILDALGEANYMVTSNIGIRPYAEYAYNTSGSDRFNNAIAGGGANAAKIRAAGNDDSAWLVGITVGSAKDLKSFQGKKMAKGDWSANLWYQSVGIYALDPNSVDTDIFDGRVNMEGTSFKAQYNLQDNVALNFTAAHGTRKNDLYAAVGGNKVDIKYGSSDAQISSLDLLQFDVTYKF